MLEPTTLTGQFPYLGLFVLLVLGGIGLPFPEDTTLILGGFLLGQDVIKPLPAFLTLYSGLLATDFFLYLVGRKYGRRVVEHRRFRLIISPERFSKLEEKFKRWGSLVVFFGRHLLVLRAQIFLAAGAMRMSAVKFIIADGISSLFTLFVMGGIGYVGGNSFEMLKRNYTRVEHAVIVGLVVLLAVGIVFWYWKKNKKI